MRSATLNAQQTEKRAVAPRRRRSKRGLETEQKFLAAANQVFWANGFGRATIMQILEASGLSVGSFYHRFSDKEELLQIAADAVFADFLQALADIDFSREANSDLFTLFQRLTLSGRQLVARHRGIYRAMAEAAQTDFPRFGTLARITPILAQHVQAEIGAYRDQMQKQPDPAEIAAAVQLLAMTVMQTELGLGPAFPQDRDRFACTIARGACGILGYSGKTEAPCIGSAARARR